MRRSPVEELESFFRRVRLLPLALPFLLACGWVLGNAGTRWLALPDEAARVVPAPVTPVGYLEQLAFHMGELRSDGRNAEEYVLLYNHHVRPVESALQRWGVEPDAARRIAWPLVENAYALGLDPATVAAVVLVESSGRPTATSVVGARGLMQVMPLHRGQWGCGPDLYDIDSNLCYGTRILEWNLRRFGGDEERALLAYNGCVNGTTTPDCHTYPDKVDRFRRLIRAEWARISPETAEAVRLAAGPAAASP